MSHLLEVDDVSKSFGGHAVVRHVSFVLDAGASLGLVGSNGAGKTTLFRCIAGELPIDSGSILLDGDALPSRPDARARRGIARTFQIVELFGGQTVLDHVLVALQAHQGHQGPWRDLVHGGRTSSGERERCMGILALVGLADRAETPATTLSLGDRRAVELARALVGEPRLLLADEPSSGLDGEESRILIHILNRVRKETGVAVILVDHDLGTVKAVADTVIAMDAGAVIAAGTYETVVSNPQVMSSWLGQSS